MVSVKAPEDISGSLHNNLNTTDLTGEYGDNDFVMNRGDSRISITLAKDEYTCRLGRNDRFLVDDYDSKNVLAYRLTKPFKMDGTFNGNGTFTFILVECNTEDTDNFELHIANYYDHFPKQTDDDTGSAGDTGIDTPDMPSGKKVWF